MKRLFLSAVALLCILPTQAANPEEIRYGNYPTPRREIFLPKVNGYNVYKADLHIHSIYSDGHVTPDGRVTEAWYDGLDIIAMTEHLESRKREQEYLNFLKGYNGGTPKTAKNWWVYKVGPDEDGILADLNVATQAAVKQAASYDMTLIPGIEITREPVEFGHFNLLFLKDANLIFDRDPLQALRNAREQGAFIIHNHPQFSKKTKSTMPPHCEDFYAKGLIDGIEVINSYNFYDRLFDYCIEGGYTPFANSDAHNLIALRFPNAGKDYFRNMTLILAERCDEQSIHEALKAGRTIAYQANMLIGKEELLSELFKESVTVEVVGEDSKRWKVRITNHSSLPYSLRWEGKKEGAVFGQSSALLNVKKGTKELDITVTNMFYGKEKSPVVSFKLNNK